MEELTHLVLRPHLLQRLLHLLGIKKVILQVRSTACENSPK
uniref:Alternative protein KCTD3 n=1 Tax=Homo sapiens TaxID=9606 RepID=L0R4Z3_HUMAN|nr:alternative protein KCTD3 [Homo sapiens]